MRAFEGPVSTALAQLPVTILILDPLDCIHWMNEAAKMLVGGQIRIKHRLSGVSPAEAPCDCLETPLATFSGEVTSTPIHVRGRVIGSLCLIRTDHAAKSGDLKAGPY